MRKIVECVPNFSEGRRIEVIDQIVAAITSVPGVTLLDKEMNADHNRAVISFIGEPDSCVEAAFRGARTAQQLIDLNQHQGEHPRMGATDVIPFVPIANVTMDECVELAKKLGKRLADELGIPVYLYEAAATRPDRVDLANIRKGEFEELKAAIKTDPQRQPDFGKPELHPTAGATVVGARFPLIAYNVNLNTPDLEIAKKIAKAIRFRDGGFRYAKALGFEIKEKNCAQVSINMTNFLATPLFRTFETIKRETERYGVMIKESEIVGLVPQQALIDTAVYFLQLDTFHDDQILENRLLPPKGLHDFVGEVASAAPVPGGGSCAALAGALGAGLLLMVIDLTIGKKGYEAVEEEMKAVKENLKSLPERFLALVDEDAWSFEAVIGAYKLPKGTEADKIKRTEAIQAALVKASLVPLETMERTAEALRSARPLAEKGNKNSLSDVGVGAMLLETCLRGARLNVLINLGGIKDPDFVLRTKTRVSELTDQAALLAREATEAVERTLTNG
jgi:glutamate formiminotransferase/formiminotetrahydrofolate cyclodeaminase